MEILPGLAGRILLKVVELQPLQPNFDLRLTDLAECAQRDLPLLTAAEERGRVGAHRELFHAHYKLALYYYQGSSQMIHEHL